MNDKRESIREMLLSHAMEGDWTALKLYLELAREGDDDLSKLRRDAERQKLARQLSGEAVSPVLIIADIAPRRGRKKRERTDED